MSTLPSFRRRFLAVPVVLGLLAAAVTSSPDHVAADTETAGGFTTAVRPESGVVSRGSDLSLAIDVTASAGRTALVDVEIYDANGRKTFQWAFDDETFAAGRPRTLTVEWPVPASLPTGTYSVKVGVFGPGWSSLIHWNNDAAQVRVYSLPAGQPPVVTPAPVTTERTWPTTPPPTTAPPTTPAPTAAPTTPPPTAAPTTPPPTAAPTTAAPPPTAPPTGGSTFFEGWDTAPAAPVPFGDNDRWDVMVHTRDLPDGRIFPMDAQHSATCGGPPETHHAASVADLVFICNNHLMTSIDGGEYGAVYLTPKTRLDFTQSAVVEFDISSFQSSNRDWWDVWILPEDVASPGDESYSDGQFPLPDDAIHVKLQVWQDSPRRTGIEAHVHRNGQHTTVNTETYNGLESFLVPSAARRDTIRIELSPTSLSVCMPDYGKCFADDVTIPRLDWTSGVVKFGHHSYNPRKDDTTPGGATPGTWHWDSVFLSPVR